eukprot:Skav213730  [mRNA]  locus=scaffold2563:259738:264541:- [translate_table: standard]
MANPDLPSSLWDLVYSHECSLPPFRTGAIINLVIQDLALSEESSNQVICQISPKQLKTISEFFCTGLKAVERAETSETIVVHLDDETAERAIQAERVYLHQFRVEGFQPIRLTATEKSLVVPHDYLLRQELTKEPWMIEHYAGGFGGWHYAEQQIQKVGAKPHHILALESNMAYATQYSLSHHTTLITESANMPPDFVKEFEGNIIIVTKTQELAWQKQVCWINHDKWTISSPCQSWSGAGSQQGFEHPNGMCFASTVTQARIHRPKVLMLEQAPGFPKHAHFRLAMTLMRWAGYREVFSATLDLANITPTRRSRWLAIFVHEEAEVTDISMQSWPVIHCTPRSYDFEIPLTRQQSKQFEPTVEQAAKYFQECYMPTKSRSWTHAQILAYRVPSQDQKIPTFLHQYGGQHDLPEASLRSKGLLGHFLRSGVAFRFFASHEIALLHLQLFPITLLKPSKLSWETTGNSISIGHASHIIAHAAIILNQLEEDFSVTQMILDMVDKRFTASNTVLFEDEFAWYLGDSQQTIASDITGTHPFRTSVQMMLALVPGEYGIYHVDSEVTWASLLNLWNNKLLPMDFDFKADMILSTIGDTMQGDKLRLTVQAASATPLFEWPEIVVPRPIALHRASTDLWLYEIADDTTWGTCKTNWKNTGAIQASNFDVMGSIPDHHVFTHDTLCVHEAYFTQKHLDLQEPSGDFASISMEVVTPPQTDILVLHCSGTEKARQQCLQFWQSATMNLWYRQEGRQSLRIRLFQVFMHAITTDIGIRWIIKEEQRIIHDGIHAPTQEMRPIYHMLSHLQQLITGWGTPAIVTGGKRCGDIATISDLNERNPNTDHVLSRLLQPTRGGGPNKAPTTKQEFHKMVEAGLAQLFLDQSLDLPQVAASTTHLIDSIGLPKLHHMLTVETGTTQQATFRRLCSAANIDLPNDPTRAAVTKGKFQKLKQSQSKTTKTLALDQYHLSDGFFVNQDGSMANLLQHFAPGLSGVALMDPTKAKQWQHITQPTSPDELAIYVVGQPSVETQLPSQEIHAPAVDSKGRPVLLTGKLIQFGSKAVATKAMDSKPTELHDVQIVSITLWKSDFAEDMWNRLVLQPVKTSRDLLHLEGFGDLFGKACKRSFRAKGVSVEATAAESIQYHTEVFKTSRFQGFLKRSGFNAVFVVPKTAQGDLDPAWKVIWTNLTPQQLEIHSTALAGTAGLIRGTKNHGLRIEAAQFPQAWAALKPSTSLPDMRQMEHTYRLQPLPLGIDAEIIRKWALDHKWDVKPLKSTGAKRWVVAANSPPPNFLVFNGQPVSVGATACSTIQEHRQCAHWTQNVHTQVSEHGSPGQFQCAHSRPNGSMGTLLQHQKPGHCGSSSTRQRHRTTHPGRTCRRPILTTRFQVAGCGVGYIQQMKLEQDQHRAQADKKLDYLDGRITQQAQATQQGLDHLQREQQGLQQCISDALALQDSRLVNAMDELKALFQNGRGTKRTSPSASDEEELSE